MTKNIVEIAQNHSREIEDHILGEQATASNKAKRRYKELCDVRPNFFRDTDRILHSKCFTRYIDKTQVFYLVDNDDITHRVLHVQFVSKIARVIGRVLSLNEDLIEAIALGHDLGHPPFGHEGETYLDKLCINNRIGHFVHSVQSVIFLDNIEKRLGNKSLNLSLQVLDGILCHDGETSDKLLSPKRNKTWAEHLLERQGKVRNKAHKLIPMTLEGCVVRYADTISYIGRDIEDAITLDLIERKDLPLSCTRVLGNNNRDIINTLVSDIIMNSKKQIDKIGYSNRINDALVQLKKYNYEAIYKNNKIKRESQKIEKLYNILFEGFLIDVVKKNEESEIFKQWVDIKDQKYITKCKPPEIVRDYIASLTDDYFIELFRRKYFPMRFGIHYKKGE